jgi:hypothetical protein
VSSGALWHQIDQAYSRLKDHAVSIGHCNRSSRTARHMRGQALLDFRHRVIALDHGIGRLIQQFLI